MPRGGKSRKDVELKALEHDGPNILDENIERAYHDHIDMKLDAGVDWDTLLTAPNCKEPADIPAAANIANEKGHGEKPTGSSGAIGHLIEPGKIGVLNANGRTEVIGPGRWLFPNPLVSLKRKFDLTENPIHYETLTIVRVNRGQYGLAMNAGRPVVLAEGLHVYNSRLFSFEQFAEVNQEHIGHQTIHLIRVPKGSFALVTESNFPRLLAEGQYAINSPVFSFQKIVSENQEHVAHGTIHVVRVPKGHVACIFDNNIPLLLPEGTHHINSNSFNFDKMANLASQVIRHGTITRFRVRHGEIGLGWENNVPTFFEEGEYEKNSANFLFDRCVSASEKLIQLGSRKVITVYDGEIGVSYDSGKLKVLNPARHVIESQTWNFDGFLSTQQQCISLASQGVYDPVDAAAEAEEARKKGAEEGKEGKRERRKKNRDYTDEPGIGPESKEHPSAHDDTSLLICETKDFVEIGIKADVFYKVVNPEKALLVVGINRIDGLVRETSIASLNSIIRSTSLAEVAQSSAFDPPTEKEHAEQNRHAPSAPLFFDKVHDAFISQLRDQFLDQYGIDIRNIRIEAFKIMDVALAQSISAQAFTTSQTHNQLANLAGQTEIALAQQTRDANLARIRAEGEAMKLRTETDARNSATMQTARTDADALLLRAEAEGKALELKAKAQARATELQAEADANSIRMRAKAEQERGQLLGAAPLSAQLAMVEAQRAVLASTFQGVSKMMFLPPEAAANPMSFFALAGGSSGMEFMKEGKSKK